MLAVNPVKELVKLLVPEPSVEIPFAVVGVAVDELQHTPLAVTADPPSEVTDPPLVAVPIVIEEAAVVVNAGTLSVLKEISLP